MPIERPVFFPRVALRLMFAAGTAALLSGCADATRFSDPFSDPFQTSSRSVDHAPTGTIARQRTEDRSIQSQPLPPAHASNANPPPPAVASAAPAVKRAGAYNKWSAEGGTPVVMAQGETAGMIANRYGVPVDALLRVNGFASASEVQPGARLVVPVYRANVAQAEDASGGASQSAKPGRLAEPAARSTKQARTDADERRGGNARNSADASGPKPTSAKPSAGKQKSPTAEDDAKANKAKARLGQVEPAQKSSASAKAAQPAKGDKPAQDDKRAERPSAAENSAVQKAEVAPGGSVHEKAEDKQADSAHPEFRWPARGRIIQAFNSAGNDGINISVPEGTAVKAAESGVVAYAGSELKGYGNLVLIRHPNGFVSAYAHNGEIDVKRGDQVKRGQTIAKSGQSGNVGSPQLHFELRKGSTPVDPTHYLAGL